MGMVSRAVIVCLVLVCGHFVVEYVKDGYSFGKVVPPTTDLKDSPLTFAGWQGEDLPEDPRLREILCAKSGIDRLYRKRDGSRVLIHGVWTDDYLKLHFPQQCYRESGWEQVDSIDVKLNPKDFDNFTGRIITFAQGDRKIQVLYWFQLGPYTFLDRFQHRMLRRQVCWGQKEWPPLMKFMLETPYDPVRRSGESLVEFAEQFYCHAMESEES
ncbi:hypothetical protein Mal65_42860 [Crateriforma conspicua]|nr:hypothetical protein Mal65_42860 [Crateriforma conspicua]